MRPAVVNEHESKRISPSSPPVQVGLSVLSFVWLPPQLAKCTFYMFLSCVLYVNIGRCNSMLQ